MNSKTNSLVKYLFWTAGIALLILSITPVRAFIINNIVETLIHRNLRDFSKWDVILKHGLYLAIFAELSVYICAFTGFGKNIWNTIKSEFSKIFSSKNFIRNFTILFAIFAVAFFALIHASYDYADDIRRTYTGERSWVGSSRYISEIFSIIFHTNLKIEDITPITQLWATAFITTASFLMAWIFSSGNITFLTLIPASFLGLSPFFLSNLAYKFDSPYMAAAILFGVLPFLFTEDEKTYIYTSIVSIILVCISYQAANPMYIILTIYVVLQRWIQKRDLKETIRFALVSILCFIVSLVIFKLFFLNFVSSTDNSSYADFATSASLSKTFISNLKAYFSTVCSYWGNLWIKFFTAAFFVLFTISSVKSSKQNKLISLAVTVAAVLLMTLLSFGAYLVLAAPILHPRAFMGFSCLVTTISLFSVINSSGKLHNLTVCAAVFLFYGLIVLDAVFGNVMAKQKSYEDFRITLLLSDLNHIVDPTANNTFYIHEIPENPGKANIDFKNYKIPFVKISPQLSQYLLNDRSMYFQNLSGDMFQLLPENIKQELEELPLISDSYYHTIRGKNGVYYIFLKNPVNPY